VLDAVLVHELAHLVYPDHSPRFHELADRFAPPERGTVFLEGYSLGLDAGPGVPATADPLEPGQDLGPATLFHVCRGVEAEPVDQVAEALADLRRDVVEVATMAKASSISSVIRSPMASHSPRLDMAFNSSPSSPHPWSSRTDR